MQVIRDEQQVLRLLEQLRLLLLHGKKLVNRVENLLLDAGARVKLLLERISSSFLSMPSVRWSR